tara:strand:- start:488 stop:874 length:387 start_codon:yes stop_codon:yes gene_type:complete
MKITDITKLSGKAGSGANLGVVGDTGFLEQIQETIKQFKGMMEIAKQFKGDAPAVDPHFADKGGFSSKAERESLAGSPPQSPAAGLAEVIKLLIDRGYGDTPVGELVDKIRPFTLRQIAGVANARLKK